MIWSFTVPNWHPATLNQLMQCHWAKKNRLKNADKQMIATYGRHQFRIPEAKGKRRVSLILTLGYRQRKKDADNLYKSLLDALVACKLLVDDSPKWCMLGTIEYRRGTAQATEIILEDV